MTRIDQAREGTGSTNLSENALHELVRALADRGEDYGWNVYVRGSTIPAGSARQMIAWDENAQAWLDAFRWAVRAYRAATGTTWRY